MDLHLVECASSSSSSSPSPQLLESSIHFLWILCTQNGVELRQVKEEYTQRTMNLHPLNVQDRSLHCPSNAIRPFQYTTSLKTTSLQNATPNWKRRGRLKSSMYSACHKNQQAYGTVDTRIRVRWLILESLCCTGNMYRIIHA